MTIIALTHEEFWQLANILGLVVVVAVAALLTILVVLVRRIEERVGMVRETLKAAVANTSDAELISETAKRVDAVLTEGLQHHLFLGRVLDKVRA
jgi:Tfp pilus assembly major pilin PilA